MRFLHVTLFSLIASSCHFTAFSAELEPVEVSVYARFYYPQDPVRPTTRRSIEIMREDPGIRIVQWSGLLLPFGGSGYRRSASRSAILMSIAGKSAPDIIETFVGGIRNDVRQGLLHPLNEWIGEDLDGNGLIDDDECEWEAWKAIDPLIRRVVTVDGKVYGIPQAYTHYAAVIFRTDLIRAAGLDSNEPPKTWDELMQIRTSPTKGIDYEFPPDQTVFLTPDGEDLSSVQSTWRANFASPEGIAAAEFFHRLRWMKWIKDPETGEPIELSPDDVEEGQTSVDGRMVAFEEDNLIQGVARAETGQRHNGKWELLGRGEVAMLTWSVGDLTVTSAETGIDPDLLSWFPFPAPKGGQRGVVVNINLASMVEAVGERTKHERDKVWKVITGVTDDRVLDAEFERRVRAGLARFVKPMDLKPTPAKCSGGVMRNRHGTGPMHWRCLSSSRDWWFCLLS